MTLEAHAYEVERDRLHLQLSRTQSREAAEALLKHLTIGRLEGHEPGWRYDANVQHCRLIGGLRS